VIPKFNADDFHLLVPVSNRLSLVSPLPHPQHQRFQGGLAIHLQGEVSLAFRKPAVKILQLLEGELPGLVPDFG
jgi:hypothetical protein